MRYVIICLLFLVLFTGCVEYQISQEQAEEASGLSDIQVTICDSAQKGDTCYKLEELNIVTKEECCQNFGQCCS